MNKSIKNNFIVDEKGQSLVEFVLLLAIIVGISFGYMSGINNGLEKRWQVLGNILIQDTDNGSTLEVR
ncbi:MAG: hypothetical protein N4A33_09055 [Bacteriovoracaceae bacterium]|nr:hypothetical protein [Bacteriovoracaceae bacterium]